jgi:hypothetical protein
LAAFTTACPLHLLPAPSSLSSSSMICFLSSSYQCHHCHHHRPFPVQVERLSFSFMWFYMYFLFLEIIFLSFLLLIVQLKDVIFYCCWFNPCHVLLINVCFIFAKCAFPPLAKHILVLISNIS